MRTMTYLIAFTEKINHHVLLKKSKNVISLGGGVLNLFIFYTLLFNFCLSIFDTIGKKFLLFKSLNNIRFVYNIKYIFMALKIVGS